MATKNWFSATQKNSVNDTDKILMIRMNEKIILFRKWHKAH